MRHFILSLAFVAGAIAYTPALAQDSGGLSCKDLIVPIKGVPKETALSFTLTENELLKQCTSSTGAKLTLTYPLNGVQVAPVAGSSQAISFTVQDSKGNTSTAKVIVTRDQG